MVQDAYDFCKFYIKEGETILWKGKPEEGISPTKNKWGASLPGGLNFENIIFGLVWIGFVIWWTAIAENLLFVIFGMLGILFGLYWFVGSHFYIAWRRKHTKYVITNLRVIRQQRKNVEVLKLEEVCSAYVRMYENGNGTIYLNTNGRIGAAAMRKVMAQPEVAGDQFFHIENISQVDYVCRILEENIPK